MQVGAGGIKSLTGGRTVMSMEEILESLTVKARLEAEDGQRQLLGALNGIAALQLLEVAPADAVATYRQALTLGQPPLLPVSSLFTSNGRNCCLEVHLRRCVPVMIHTQA